MKKLLQATLFIIALLPLEQAYAMTPKEKTEWESEWQKQNQDDRQEDIRNQEKTKYGNDIEIRGGFLSDLISVANPFRSYKQNMDELDELENNHKENQKICHDYLQKLGKKIHTTQKKIIGLPKDQQQFQSNTYNELTKTLKDLKIKNAQFKRIEKEINNDIKSTQRSKNIHRNAQDILDRLINNLGFTIEVNVAAASDTERTVGAPGLLSDLISVANPFRSYKQNIDELDDALNKLDELDEKYKNATESKKRIIQTIFDRNIEIYLQNYAGSLQRSRNMHKDAQDILDRLTKNLRFAIEINADAASDNEDSDQEDDELDAASVTKSTSDLIEV